MKTRRAGTFARLFGRFAQGYSELGFAGDGGIVEGFGGAVGFGRFEEEAALEVVGEAAEAGFAVGVGADFQIELVGAHESVGDVDFDLGGVDGGARGVGDREVGGARANAAIYDGDRLRLGGARGLREGRDRRGEKEESQRQGACSELVVRHVHPHIRVRQLNRIENQIKTSQS